MQHTNNLNIKLKYLILLSGFCGHTDLELRTISWCILAKMSQTINGQTQLIKELSYLPGGFHACCLSSFLDSHEASIVREAAGGLFANLLKYRDDSQTVMPRCAEKVIIEE